MRAMSDVTTRALRLATASGLEGLEEALRAFAALERILPASVRAEVGAVSAGQAGTAARRRWSARCQAHSRQPTTT